MTEQTKRQLFNQVMDGQPTSRTLMSTWCHFLADENEAETLAAATINYARTFDWDWIKYNPRAIYVPEAWGNKYDYNAIDWVFPRLVKSVLTTPEDLAAFPDTLPINSPSLVEQARGMALVQEALPDTPVLATIFSPLSILLLLAGLPITNNGFTNTSVDGLSREDLFETYADETDRVLAAIADGLARYIQQLHADGVDGIFFATTSTAALFTPEQFERFSVPHDATVLTAAPGMRSILHTCGDHARPEFFQSYPVDALSWDTHAEGNLPVDAELSLPTVCGVSRHAFDRGDIVSINEQSAEALAANAGRPFVLTPDCAISSGTSESALHAFRGATR
ncbi:uroporphyrinogen decarboxylase family protein [Lysinibacter cavernae]|uniref:Uroporphyrinogen decarboxylase n=1 Tax=Lysinibacter cavernae TaxID=1640652 RepID=A0A7X5R3G2_9MICO|nr:uroporphyrinogen decarboxylase family protein [Lysinibacter cavernae]NIH54934.1 uroporphyrinogen decarboxylase [Lysinibacter cavernae]